MQAINATGEWGDASAPPSSPPAHPGNWFFRRPHWLDRRAEVRDLEKRVYAVLLTRADGQNVARVGIETIADDLGKGYSTVKKAIAGLAKHRLIAVTLRREHKGASDYRLRAHEWQAEFVAESHAKRREAARSSRPSEWFSRAPQWLECRIEVSDSAKLVYALLANHADRLNGTGELVATVRIKTLAKEAGKHFRTVQRALRELAEHGLIERRLRCEFNGASDYAVTEGHRWQAEFVERVAKRATGNRFADGFDGFGGAEPHVKTEPRPHVKTELSPRQNRAEPHVKTEPAEESLSKRNLKQPVSEESRTDAREQAGESEPPAIDGPRIHVRVRDVPMRAKLAPIVGETDAAKRATAKRAAYQAEIEESARGYADLALDAAKARAAGNDRGADAIDRCIARSFEAMERDPKRGIRYRADVKRRVFEILAERAGMPPRELPPAEPANVEPESFSEAPNDGTA